MLTKQKFMEKVHVTREEYVDRWISKKLIPGVIRIGAGHLLFPNSAKRPYRARCRKDANKATLCASIVNACLKNRHICKETYAMTSAEFNEVIYTLTASGLIFTSIKDGIVYYESGVKLFSYKKATYREIKKYVSNCLALQHTGDKTLLSGLLPSVA